MVLAGFRRDQQEEEKKRERVQGSEEREGHGDVLA